MSEEEKRTIQEIIEELETINRFSSEDVQTIIYNHAKKLDTKEFFKKLYNIFLGKDKGPRIGSLFAAIGKEKVIEFLKKACK